MILSVLLAGAKLGERDDIDDRPDLACVYDKKVTKKTLDLQNDVSRTELPSEFSKEKKGGFFFIKVNNERSNADILQKKIDELKDKLRQKTNKVNQLCDLVKSLKEQNKICQSQVKQLLIGLRNQQFPASA